MSFPHRKEEVAKRATDSKNGVGAKDRTIMITLRANLSAVNEVRMGQGLLSTKWKGLNFFTLVRL